MEELTEVITAAEFHPTHCNLFMYSSSKGTVKLADMRESALCDRHVKRQSIPTFAFAPYSRDGDGRVRRRRGPYDAFVLLGDHFIHIRRQIQSRWSVHSFPGLPFAKDLGRQHGVAADQNDPDPRSSSREALRPVRE